MKRLTTREQLIFIVCLFLFFAYLGYQLGLKPLREKAEFLDTRIVAEEKKLAKEQDVVGNTGVIEETWQAYLTRFKQTRSNEQVMSAMVSEIEGVAGELGLRIADLKPRRVKAEEYGNRFSVSLTMDSSLPDIVHFLHKLQDQPYWLSVEEFRFDKGSRAEATSLKTQLVLTKILIP